MNELIQVAQEDEQAMAARFEVAQALGEALCKKRKEAQQWRQQIGIEQDWQEDEEFYNAIDSANPEGESNVEKPTSPNGGVMSVDVIKQPGRANAFIPITRGYVDAASARVSDMLLPNDEANFAFKPTPVQDEVFLATGQMPSPVAQGAQVMANPQDGTQKTPADLACEKAFKIVWDWLVEGQYHAEVRKVIESAAKYGTGVLKGPIPTVRRGTKFNNGVLEQFTKIIPTSKAVDIRHVFPMPDCGENIQNGSGVFEFDTMSARQLRDCMELESDGYIPELIAKVLEEGPDKRNKDRPDSPTADKAPDLGGSFPIWHFYGDIDRETLETVGVPEEDFADDAKFSVPAIVTIANDTVIRVVLSPIPEGDYPFDFMPWQRIAGIPWGKGVARQMRTPQRMLNAAVRSMLDNGGLTSGPQYGARRGWIEPMDGQWTLSPRKGWWMTDEASETAKIGDALSFTNIQANTAEMQSLIQQALKFAEDSTGLPMLLQGQQGNAPDTVGGMTILNNNGSTVLRRIARTFDDCVTEPHVRRYHRWLLIDPEVPGDAKYEFQIDARGSTALVDRDLQNQALNQLVPTLMASQKVDKDKLVEQLMRANRLDPKSVFYSDQEYEQIKKQPPPPPIPVAVAQIKEQGAMQRQQQDLQFKAQRGQMEDNIRATEIQSDHEIGLAKVAAQLNISEQQLKVLLAEVSMKLNTQVALSDADRATQAVTPPTEPAGRAPDGQAFQA